MLEKTKKVIPFEKFGNQTRKITKEEKDKIRYIEDFLDVDFTRADFTIDCVYAICKKLENLL